MFRFNVGPKTSTRCNNVACVRRLEGENKIKKSYSSIYFLQTISHDVVLVFLYIDIIIKRLGVGPPIVFNFVMYYVCVCISYTCILPTKILQTREVFVF